MAQARANISAVQICVFHLWLFFANNLRRLYQTRNNNRNFSSIFIPTPATVFQIYSNYHIPLPSNPSGVLLCTPTWDRGLLLLSSEGSKTAATRHYTLCVTQDSAHALCLRIVSDLYISMLGTQLIRQTDRMLVHDVQITLRGYFQHPQVGTNKKMARTHAQCATANDKEETDFHLYGQELIFV
jgi:hypothetical protein